MWGTFLSEPLDIVGLVGPYPANYLIVACPSRTTGILNLEPCGSRVSWDVSPRFAGYLPVRGWLHTCYSPVRRSPPGYCYPVLPLDLHVLSLSLAFILSQDQTLHTKIIFQKSSLAGSCVHESRLPSIRFTLATLLFSRQYCQRTLLVIFIAVAFSGAKGVQR